MSPIARIFAAGAALFAVATAGVAAAQNYGLAPTYGTVNLTAGFMPDPVNVNILSGGRINAGTRFNGCLGFIADAPDVRLNYQAGGSLPLILSVNSSADTTLVVNGPDGRWYCDDDGGNTGLNPSLRFASMPSGQYDIWIGTYGNATNQEAVLSISELYTH